MKKLAIAGVFFLFFGIFTFNPVLAEEVVIGPYPVGEFAVKGQIESQLKELAKKITAEIGGRRVNIGIIGSADNTGKSSKNDQLAQNRAKDAESFLRFALPPNSIAGINSWSQGQEGGIRKVVVNYDFSPSASFVKVGEDSSWANGFFVSLKKILFFFGVHVTVLFLIVSFTAIFYISWWRKKEKKKEAKNLIKKEAATVKEMAREVLREIEEEKKPPEETIENISIGGRRARMKVRRTPEGGYVSEVSKKLDGSERVFEKRGDWINSTRSILKKSPELVEKLVKDGVLEFKK